MDNGLAGEKWPPDTQWLDLSSIGQTVLVDFGSSDDQTADIELMELAVQNAS